MWVIMAVSIQLLSGPNSWAVADQGTFENEAECEAALSEAVPRTLSDGMRLAWEQSELKFICLKVRDS
ncbi:hypothetical protein [Roseibium sediminicola]|uniref:Uncharacterized protein n=1 Tax=Roseibium sediminicola TaxID=2933272 RepID=A0ABT0GPG1_9HYPH|nr:hypothetical protein [Roseibium sp. CAU 1639]MCK7611201.1 hypothetical protein [Roseibium sp. CAU 1639]